MLPRLLLLACLLAGCAAPALPPPNVVLIVADDLGWGDLSCYGGRAGATPELDRLARESARFSDFYVSQPVCSASRASILTGRYAERTGVRGALGPGAKHALPAGEITLAELCRPRGHASALLGKWHLGDTAGTLPLAQGFGEFWGIPYSSDMWPFHPEQPQAYPPLPLYEGAEVVATNPTPAIYTTEPTQRALRFLRRHADEPFLLVLAHPLPHVPLGVARAGEGASGAGLYADVLLELDRSTGAIAHTLVELGLERRTLLVFTSDNGPWLSHGDLAGSAGPLREGKGTVFEGGVRVPCIAWMPGTIPAGRLVREPAMAIDLLPTVAELVGVPLPPAAIDGRSLLPLLRGGRPEAPLHDALCFSYEPEGLQALRSGRWKLHLAHGYRSMEGRAPGRGGQPGSYDYGRRIERALFDLETDPGETRDVAAAHPDVVARLVELALAARVELGP